MLSYSSSIGRYCVGAGSYTVNSLSFSCQNDLLFENFGTAGFLGCFGFAVVCLGAGGGLTFPGSNSKMVRNLS